MSLTSSNVFFSIGIVAIAVLATEAKLLPAAVANSTRESRQMVYLYPYAIEKGVNAPSVNDEINNYEQHPRRFQHVPPSQGTSSADERFFGGLSNILTGRPLCPTCPSCPNCPTCISCPACAVCAAPCAATTNAASPISFNFVTATSCSDPTNAAATGYGFCSTVSAAPTGVFTVTNTLVIPAATAPQPTAFIGIRATCPNNRITVTCGAIPANYFIVTQTGQQIGGAVAVPGGGTLVESSGFIQIMVRAGNGATALSSVQCSWTATP